MKILRHPLLILLTLAFTLYTNLSYAQTWTGGGTDNNWDNPANWTGGPPGPTEIAFIGENYSVIIPVGLSVEIKYLTIGNNSSVQVQSGADLIINNASGDGIFNKGNFLNFGTVEINNSGGHAIRLFLDTATGMQYGIFQNYGNLYIDGCAQDGIYGEADEIWYSEGESFFYNFWDGYIEMNNIGGSAFNTNHLENQGRIKIVGSLTDYGILLDDPDGEIVNTECGKIILQSEIHIIDGTFTNAGFINQDYGESNTLSSPGIFTNDGFLEDHYGSFQPLTFGNTGTLLYPLDPYAAPFEGAPIPFITIGNTTAFDFSPVFSERALITPAGTYNKTTNVWNTQLVDPTDTTFFMEVTNISATCKDTVKFILKKPFLPMNYWIGGSSFWNQASNWSKGYVPQAGDTAAVYDNTVTATVPANYNGELQNLIVTGNIVVEASASLTFGGSPMTQKGLEMDGGTFTNHGDIILSESNTGIYISPGVFTNHGDITATGMEEGIYVNDISQNEGTLINHGIISIIDCVEGLKGENMVNEVGGLIQITNPVDVGFYSTSTNYNYGSIVIRGGGTAIGVKGEMDNHADIDIRRMDIGMEAEGNNHGTISIDTVMTAGIDHDDAWNNQEDGVVTIKNCPIGIKLSDGLLDNYGTLNISKISGDAINGTGSLNNETDGIITIDDVAGHGIFTYSSIIDYGDLYNEGLISIGNCGGNGLQIEGARFNNGSLGEIYIDHIPSGNGVFIDFGLYFSEPNPIFENDGLFKFGENIGAWDIRMESTGPIFNRNCNGVINLKHGLLLNGDFHNFGFIIQDFDGVNNFAGTFYNDGLIHDVQASFNGTNLDNDGLYLKSIPGTQEINTTISTNFGAPYLASGHLVRAEWYLDKELTVLGGQFDLNANELLLNPECIGKDTLYFGIYNPSCSNGTMRDTVMILFDNPIEADCGNINWEGGTSVWHNTANWNKNRLPLACDTVNVMGVLDSVLITNVEPIFLNSIQNNGTLRIGQNADVTVDGANDIGIRIFGNLIVDGSLTVKNTGSHGIFGNDGVILNKGIIELENIGGDGIRLQNSSFDHRPGAQVTILNCVNRNIFLKSGSEFLVKGVIVSE